MTAAFSQMNDALLPSFLVPYFPSSLSPQSLPPVNSAIIEPKEF